MKYVLSYHYYLSLLRSSWDSNMENSNKNKNISTKKEPDTLKKSEVVTNDDKKGKIILQIPQSM